VFKVLEGKTVNLRIMEKEDLPLFADWLNNSQIIGEFNPLRQTSKTEIEKDFEKKSFEQTEFIIEKKDRTKIGYIWHFTHPATKVLEIGTFLIPSERGKGYAPEATHLIVDYLFLSKNIVRIQAGTQVENVASQKALEKSGFTREGVHRKEMFNRGKWVDICIYSILREEWKEPKILTKAV
jgi:ribosomal-protein-alanine N-acetyltransferase